MANNSSDHDNYKAGFAQGWQNPSTQAVQPHEVGSQAAANAINAGIRAGQTASTEKK